MFAWKRSPAKELDKIGSAVYLDRNAYPLTASVGRLSNFVLLYPRQCRAAQDVVLNLDAMSQLSSSEINIALLTLGGLVIGLGLFSGLLKERFFLSDPLVALVVGVLLSPSVFWLD